MVTTCKEESIVTDRLNDQNSDNKSRSDDEVIRIPKKDDGWPSPDNAVYHGVMGDIVRTIEPHSEADPIAILIHLLAFFGNAVKRSAHYLVERDWHYTNLFAVLVGDTSKGRKGVSKGHAVDVFRSIDNDWTNQILSGLSTGEGLISAVPNDDLGAKRLFVIEAEFARVLKVLQREGNTLSAIIRDAWDTGNLRILTKNSAVSVTDAHISIVGHITRDELCRCLSSTEVANGFANRFLWACVSRSKYLAFGGDLEEGSLDSLIKLLQDAVAFARNAGRVKFDAAASDLWRSIYRVLSDGKPGLLGAVTSRAEAQVLRLAMIYALLDCSSEIRIEHLEAALKMWDYCEQSAEYIFRDALGDPVADEILAALKATSRGLTRTGIHNHFKRNRSAVEIERALDVLQHAGRIRREVIDHTGGRDAELFKLV